MQPENNEQPSNTEVSEVGTTPTPQPAQPSVTSVESVSPAPQKSKKKIKLLVLVAVVVAVLLGTSAAAYFGVIVPNKPENKLRAAFVNLAKQKQSTVSGKFDYRSNDGSSSFSGIAVDYEVKSDLEKNQFGVSGTIGSSGAQFPFDIRSIDQDIYFKVSGLDSMQGLTDEAEGEGAFYLSLLSSLNDQWYVLDRSFLQSTESPYSCIADLSFALSESDVDRIGAAYKKHPLFKIKSVTKETVDGTATSKYELEPADKQTTENFTNELESLEVVKKVKDCAEDSGLADDKEDKPDESQVEKADTTFYAYVTNDKQLKKLEIKAEDSESTTEMTMNFDFRAVEIEKPSGAKPIQEMFGGLLGGEGDNFMAPPEGYEFPTNQESILQ